MIDCVLEHQKRRRGRAILIAARAGVEVNVGYPLVPLLGGRHDHIGPSIEVLLDDTCLDLRLIRALIEEFRGHFDLATSA